MKVPIRAAEKNLLKGLAAAMAIALAATAFFLAISGIPGVSTAVTLLDNTFYDAFYKARPAQDRKESQVVMIDIDQESVDQLQKEKNFGWPWPRIYYVPMIQFCNRHGARAIVFDLLFNNTSSHGDDSLLAKGANASKIPIVFASEVEPDGKSDPLAPAVNHPILGAPNLFGQDRARWYYSLVQGNPSLALAAVRAVGAPEHPLMQRSFLLHYYGPYVWPNGDHTFRYVRAMNLITTAVNETKTPPSAVGIDPDWFKGKIVIVCITATSGSDTKSTPLTDLGAGVEIHATAIENMLAQQEVHALSWIWIGLESLACTFIGAIGGIVPRKVWLKLAIGLLAVAMTLAIPLLLFLRPDIRWLAPTAPLAATIIAVVGAIGWSYLAEDRSRRLILKALSQYVSPAVAEELNKDPGKLKIGGERREMTVMFTDIAGFTDISEKLQPTEVSSFLNFYLDHMTGILFASDGTVDKYVGDAIMTFWNAPLPQEDHAIRGCRAALLMQKREAEIQEQLRQLTGGRRVSTRIGLNTSWMSVGNMGSSFKFNYTVLGDAVNLGSRLEAINKYYGTNVMVSGDTANAVKDAFFMRKVDVIRVKGKREPMAIYQLLSENPPAPEHHELAKCYSDALAAYQEMKWDEADKILLEILSRFPEDGPAGTLRHRIEEFRVEPPPPDWQGVYTFKEK